MKPSIVFIAALIAVGVTGCKSDTSEPAQTAGSATTSEEMAMPQEERSAGDIIEVAPGLTAVILQKGYGRAAEPGDYVDVHYTGWLYDESAENNRGSKFDSSVDRGEKFQFQLGAGRVIKGWDQGVAGMLIGEKRELTIAPEMGYGNRGAGNVIPPRATLIFEVELLGLESPGDD